MIELELVKICLDILQKKKLVKSYYIELYKSIHRVIEQVPYNRAVLLGVHHHNKDKIDHLWRLKNSLWLLETSFCDFFYYIKYLSKKEKLLNQKIIFCSNDIPSVRDVFYALLKLMEKIHTIFPMRNNVDLPLKSGYKLIDTFEKHGHFLLTTSHQKDSYYMSEILFHIRYISKIARQFRIVTIDPVIKAIDYDFILLDELENN